MQYYDRVRKAQMLIQQQQAQGKDTEDIVLAVFNTFQLGERWTRKTIDLMK